MMSSVTSKTSLPKFSKRKGTREKIKCNSEQEFHGEESTVYMTTQISTELSHCQLNMDQRGNCFASDQDSEPDRSNPTWKIMNDVSPEEEKVDERIEEETECIPTLWEEIMQEYEKERAMLEHLNMERKPFKPEIPIGKKLTAVQYLQLYIFPLLCPVLEETLFRAKKEDCLQIQKCVFNGLDHISELLWNRNSMHPRRKTRGYKNIFSIPFVKIWLYDHPRPIYPLSWIWTKEQAIIMLQSYIRRYFVCRDPDCYEMRKFWRIYRQEKKEEQDMLELMHFEEVQEIVSDILDKLVALSVYSAEEKRHGCFCVTKPCHCECKCFKWCKCCRCYKPLKAISPQFYSEHNIQDFGIFSEDKIQSKQW